MACIRSHIVHTYKKHFFSCWIVGYIYTTITTTTTTMIVYYTSIVYIYSILAIYISYHSI